MKGIIRVLSKKARQALALLIMLCMMASMLSSGVLAVTINQNAMSIDSATEYYAYLMEEPLRNNLTGTATATFLVNEASPLRENMVINRQTSGNVTFGTVPSGVGAGSRSSRFYKLVQDGNGEWTAPPLPFATTGNDTVRRGFLTGPATSTQFGIANTYSGTAYSTLSYAGSRMQVVSAITEADFGLGVGYLGDNAIIQNAADRAIAVVMANDAGTSRAVAAFVFNVWADGLPPLEQTSPIDRSPASTTPAGETTSPEETILTGFTAIAEPVSAEIAEKAAEAVEEIAEGLGRSIGAIIAKVGDAIEVTASKNNAIITMEMPAGVETARINTMAILNDDGTLMAIPTRIDEDGNVIVFIRGAGSVVLVPLSVEVSFSDTIGLTSGVQEEIKSAASLMIVQGTGGGRFDPTGLVSVQDSVTMFLRAVGLPVQWETAMETGVENNMISSGLNRTDRMSRIDTAALIANVLKSIGAAPELSDAEADGLLAQFPDVSGLSAEQGMDLAIAIELGIFRGKLDGTMGPDDVLQRSQIASLSVRLQDVIFGLV